MVVCIPVAVDGSVDPRWGRAGRVAVARVKAGELESWEEYDVGWDRLHDAGTEGGHHARIARFLREHEVEVVGAGHMGPPMEHMLRKMGIAVHTAIAGDARQALAGMLDPSEPDRRG